MMMLAQKLPATSAVGRKRIAASMPNAFRPSSFRAGAFRNHHLRRKGLPLPLSFSRSVPFSSASSRRSSPPPSFLGWLWGKYTEILIARPLLVKGGSASLIFLASDSATQKLMEPTAAWDGNRALSGAGFGVAATLWLHYWWGFLEVVVNKRIPPGAYGQNKLLNALAKVVADQLVGAPLYIYGYYCTTHFGKEWMELSNNNNNNNNNKTGGETGEENTNTKNETTSSTTLSLAVSKMGETSDRALEMLPDTLLRHWTVWPIVHTLNFYYNPIHHRVLVQNTVLIFWSGYLSHLNNGGLDLELVTPDKEVELTLKKRRGTSKRLLHSSTKHEPVATVVVASAPNQDAPLATSGRTH